MIVCDYSDDYVVDLVFSQLKTFLVSEEEKVVIIKSFPNVKERVEFCFLHNSNKYYRRGDKAYFNPFHSGQWCVFLYYLSNSIYLDSKENSIICDKIYYLNRMLNGCDLFYQVNLPEIFSLDHPLGTVIGRGTFKNYFSFAQGCTVGNNKGIFPDFGERVKMLSNSKVLGNSKIGNNVIIAANTFIKDTDIPDYSIVFGSSPHLIVKRYAAEDFNTYFETV